jgi:hypothetical protein
MASASGREGQPVHGGKAAGWLSKVFQLNPAGLHWPRAVLFLDVALAPLVVFWAIGHQEYLLSALFGVVFAWLTDPGGGYGPRAARITGFALIGAGLTALGFGIGGDAWGWLVLAAFAVTLAAGLAVMFGVRRFVGAYLLNIWFIITQRPGDARTALLGEPGPQHAGLIHQGSQAGPAPQHLIDLPQRRRVTAREMMAAWREARGQPIRPG